MSAVSIIPKLDYIQVSRQRIIQLSNGRFEAAVAQFSVLLSQLHAERFTGEVRVNFGQGAVRNVKISESQKNILDNVE